MFQEDDLVFQEISMGRFLKGGLVCEKIHVVEAGLPFPLHGVIIPTCAGIGALQISSFSLFLLVN